MKNPENPPRSRAIISSDDPQLQFLAQIAVEAAGFDVVEVSAGAESWRTLAGESFDLVISCTSTSESDAIGEVASPAVEEAVLWPGEIGCEPAKASRARSGEASSQERPFTFGDLLDAVRRSNGSP